MSRGSSGRRALSSYARRPGPPRGTTGKPKGPARMPTDAELYAARRAARRLAEALAMARAAQVIEESRKLAAPPDLDGAGVVNPRAVGPQENEP